MCWVQNWSALWKKIKTLKGASSTQTTDFMIQASYSLPDKPFEALGRGKYGGTTTVFEATAKPTLRR